MERFDGLKWTAAAYRVAMTEIPFSPSVPEWKRQGFSEEIPKRGGARALYLEYPLVTIVRITEIRATEWGLGVALQCEGLPGFGKFRSADGRSSCSIAWNYLSVSDDLWQARFVPWQLHFNAERLESLIEVARQAAEQEKTIAYRTAAYWMHRKSE